MATTRMTAGLDLVINLDADNIKKTLAALEPLGYSPIIPVSANDFANAEKRNDWINNKNMQDGTVTLMTSNI